MDERQLPHDPDVEADESLTGRPRPIHLRPRLVALVFVGGVAGVLARATLDHLFPAGTSFPATTFTINVTGAFALAVLIQGLALRGTDVGTRRSMRLLLGTGVLGGFTTYSALAVQSNELVRSNHAALAAGYAVATVVVGFVASLLGIAVARKTLAR